MSEISVVLREHGPRIRRGLQAAVSASGLEKKSGKLGRGFATKVKRDNVGNVYGISWGLPRYGFILFQGVEAGNITDSVNNRSYYTKGIQPHDFINPVLDAHVPRLAADIASVAGDLVVNQIKY